MFPHAKHTPACATQRTIENVVAPLVASNLRQPIGTVAFRHPAMRWAAVPETTIYKDGDSLHFEDKIWISNQSNTSPPPGNSVLAHELRENDLRCFVTAAPYRAHDLRALLYRNCVSSTAHHAEQTSSPKWRANASARSGGTALPTWRSWSVSEPWKM